MASSTSRHPPYWREAASLILTTPVVGPTGNDPQNDRKIDKYSNFNVLMLKRGQKSSFMANVYVYPGGVVSQSDFDGRKWSSIFEKMTGSTMSAITREFEISGPRAPMLMKDTENGLYLSPNIAFRICAIRETFEESGMLIACHKSDIEKSKSNGGLRSSAPRMFSPPSSFDAATWRKRVSNDSTEFMTLCLEHDLVPNIWTLNEWSNWLTPVFAKVERPAVKPKRYDTMFYMCCSESLVPGKTELYTDEISAAAWSTPNNWYQRAKTKEITLVGPQYYETSRIMYFPEIHELSKYARTREPQGLTRWMPISVICEDGVFFILPGDELYPVDPDYEGLRDLTVMDGTVLFHCKKAKHFHRGIRGVYEYFCNIQLPFGLLPHTFAYNKFPDTLQLTNVEAKL